MEKRIGIFILLCVSFVAVNAAVNTSSCTGCHGKNFEKSAMGKSKIVAEMSHEDVVKALLGYKDGTYGGSMKMLMKSQIGKYSDDEIKNIEVGEKSFTEKVKSAAQTVKNKTIIVAKKAKAKASKYLEKDYKTKTVLQHDFIYGYESNGNCFVVDYKNKKAKALKCSRLESASELKAKDMVPPTIGDIPNPFEGLLK